MISFTSETNESFIESNKTTPIDETISQLIPTDPMTTSFVEGAPNTLNPFVVDQTDDVEIVHHNISNTNLMPSIDEINPQGLPIDDENQSRKSSIRKSQIPNISTSATNPRRLKQPILSGSIFYVDVAYIPYHGDEHYVDSEFFRRIRARYYVLNAVEINRLTLESLIEGKQQWDKYEQSPVKHLF